VLGGARGVPASRYLIGLLFFHIKQKKNEIIDILFFNPVSGLIRGCSRTTSGGLKRSASKIDFGYIN